MSAIGPIGLGPWPLVTAPTQPLSDQQIQAIAVGPSLPARRLAERAFEAVFARPVLVTFTPKDPQR